MLIMRSQLLKNKKTTGNEGMPRVGEIIVLRDEHTNWLSNTKQSTLNTYIQGIYYKLRRLYLCIYEYVCIYIYVCNNNQ